MCISMVLLANLFANKLAYEHSILYNCVDVNNKTTQLYRLRDRIIRMVDMTTFERVKKLADSQKISIVELEERLGFGKNSLYRWKTSAPASDKLQKVADFFNVSTDYLLGRELKEQKTSELSDDALIMTLDGKEVSAADREIIIAAARAVIAQREANNKNDN